MLQKLKKLLPCYFLSEKKNILPKLFSDFFDQKLIFILAFYF